MKWRDYLRSKYKVYQRCQEATFTDLSKRNVTYLPVQDANMEKTIEFSKKPIISYGMLENMIISEPEALASNKIMYR